MKTLGKILSNSNQSFALVEKDDTGYLYSGEIHEAESLDELGKIAAQNPENPTIFLNPFRTISERGFESHGSEPILALCAAGVEIIHDIRGKFQDLKSQIALEIPPSPNLSDAEYAAKVEQIIRNEIGGGNISQAVLSRIFGGKIKNFSAQTAVQIFANLLAQKGQYFTFLFADKRDEKSTNHQYFAGATPEMHLKISNQLSGKKVEVMPIAGTFRKKDLKHFYENFLQFLRDPKEINELLQTCDEFGLKVLAQICPAGGQIFGPYLREIGSVIHTEYHFAGVAPSNLDPITALRISLHASTVAGSPIEPAVKVLKKYEADSRRYYGGQVGFLHPNGELDSGILIRSTQIDGEGNFRVQAGAGIVRDSVPTSEAAETAAKTSGMIRSILGAAQMDEFLPQISPDFRAKIDKILLGRNRNLSAYHFESSAGKNLEVEEIVGKKITIIEAEDEFCRVLGQMMTKLGAEVEIIHFADFEATTAAADLVVLGPGPGDPRSDDPKMKKLKSDTKILLARGQKLFGVCLGHQILAHLSGLEIGKLSPPPQGLAQVVPVGGREQTFGFYNSFGAAGEVPTNLEVEKDSNGTILTMKSSQFRSAQFHPESIFSADGFDFLRENLVGLLGAKVSQSSLPSRAQSVG